MNSPDQQEKYYQSRVEELSEQLIDVSKRHRHALTEVRRATVTTQLIRKLYRLDHMKLSSEELASAFVNLCSNALVVSRAALLRKRADQPGFEALATLGFVAPSDALFCDVEAFDAFACSDAFDADMTLTAQIQATVGMGNYVWAYNRVSGLALIFANGRDAGPQSWRFGLSDRSLVEAVLDVVGSVVERSRTERQLAHNAFHDNLTGLPNRGMMFRHLEECTRRTTGDSKEISALLFIDMDRFKLINDSLGHLAGDKLLVAFAQRLRRIIRPGDLVARLSGDEFAVLAEGMSTLDDAKHLAQRVLDSLRTPFRIHGHSLYANASIGIAESRPDHESAADFLRDADVAMYHAKDQGGSRYAIFGNEMTGRALSQLRLETELREAIEKEELSLYYQPIFCLKTGTVEALEALLRWHHPREGLLEPKSFVGVLQQTGMLGGLGDWVLERVARDINLWRNETGDDIAVKVCVNVSEGQFVQADFVETLSNVLREYSIDAEQIRLELTESMLLDCKGIETDVLDRLRHMGIKIMLDDFGTGYSSLSRLQKLPIDTIKIDKSFITDLDSKHEDATIVKAIISMARHLDMRIVAEGAERPAQLQTLRDLGCDCVQGFLLGRPMAASRISGFLDAQEEALGRVAVR